MKRALVLAGGGSKGAYEVGFVKALHELGIDYQIVTGTSIGALNGCLLAQKDLGAMEQLWSQMDVKQVFADGFQPDFQFDLNQMESQSNLAISFLKKYVKEKGADITPLKNIIKDLLDEDKLLSSSIDFGLCTVHYPSLKPLFITKYEMEREHIFDYLIASASCFPVFPIHSFNGQSFIDGGYFDNVPVDLALDMGADEVIVVDMKVEPTHPHYVDRPHFIYSCPYLDLGGFLDFNKETLERNQRIGYQTAMKLFHRYMGCCYTFEKFETYLFEDFYKEVLYLERYARNVLRSDSAKHIFDKFIESHQGKPLKEKDYLLVALDWLAELVNRDPTYVYQYDLFVHDLLIDFKKYTEFDYQMVSFHTSESFSELFKDVNRKGIVGRMLHTMMYPEKEVSSVDKFFSLFSKEIVMAKLLYMLYQNQ